jgi:hypothetical protein
LQKRHHSWQGACDNPRCQTGPACARSRQHRSGGRALDTARGAAKSAAESNVVSARERWANSDDSGQVFWLPDRPTGCAFPRHPVAVALAAFVPGYSGGTATDSHRLPYSSGRRQADRTPKFDRDFTATLPARPACDSPLPRRGYRAGRACGRLKRRRYNGAPFRPGTTFHSPLPGTNGYLRLISSVNRTPRPGAWGGRIYPS